MFELKIRQEPTRAKSCGFSTSILSSLTSPSLIIELVQNKLQSDDKIQENVTSELVPAIDFEHAAQNMNAIKAGELPDSSRQKGVGYTREQDSGSVSHNNIDSNDEQIHSVEQLPSENSNQTSGPTESQQIEAPSNSEQLVQHVLQSSNYVCVVTLVDQHSSDSRTVILKDSSVPIDILVGTRSTTPKIFKDPLDNNVSKLFFVFGDLSIRVPGTFRLRIDCVDIDE